MYERIIRFFADFYFSVVSLSTGISNQPELIKREKTFEWRAERHRKTRRFFFLFATRRAHYTTISILSETYLPPLNYFTFFFSFHLTPPQAFTVTNSCFFTTSTASHPHWLLHSLIPTTSPFSPFPSPLRFPFSFSSLRVAHINEHTSQRASLSFLH